jgi:ATP-dependent 26S proteasome regulatory subunit
MHEATRRVLGVLLRHLDGFDSTNKRTVVIGATNRKQVGRLQGWPAG